MLSGRGPCDELITRPEESYRLRCVIVCDLETSLMRRPWPPGGCCDNNNNNNNNNNDNNNNNNIVLNIKSRDKMQALLVERPVFVHSGLMF